MVYLQKKGERTFILGRKVRFLKWQKNETFWEKRCVFSEVRFSKILIKKRTSLKNAPFLGIYYRKFEKGMFFFLKGCLFLIFEERVVQVELVG